MSTETQMPLIFLAGGFGTRLRAVNDQVPKPMVPVLEKPFLHWLVQHYYKQGFCDFIFSTGYKAEVIESYAWTRFFPKAKVRFFREQEPLGTGGATKAIFESFNLTQAWVINGDTLLPDPLPKVGPTLQKQGWCSVYLALAASALFDAKPNLQVDGDCVVAESPLGSFFDAGAVFVERKALDLFEDKPPYSIHALLKPAMNQRRVGYWVLNGTCYDMGTAERLKRLEGYLQGHSPSA